MFIRKYLLTSLYLIWDAIRNYYRRASSIEDGMGKRMPHQEKNNKSWNTHRIMILPVTGALFPKKTPPEKPEESSLDFHLEMINKIDKLLDEHNLEPSSAETVHMPPINPTPPRVPIEPRPPLNKALFHREIAWEPLTEQPQAMTQTIPEEFKTELTINPEFRFISKQEFIDTISETRPSSKDHIEIIDLNTLSFDNSPSQKHINLIDITNQTDETSRSFLINDVLDEKRHHKKIEIIDTRTLKQKKYEDVFNASTQQAEEIDNKAKLYFLNRKDSSDDKQKQLELEQAYVPDDFEERLKKLKEKQSKEEKQQQEEKINTQLKQEPKKTEKMETHKTESQEKKLGLFQHEKKSNDIPHTETNPDLKKVEKEQLRLQRLEIRQARIEERLRKKQEKHELKIKQKQQKLEQKEKEKPQLIEKDTFINKGKSIPSLEFDEEIKKVLLMTDTLLEELPEDVLTDFMHSEDFQLYAKVLNKFKAK